MALEPKVVPLPVNNPGFRSDPAWDALASILRALDRLDEVPVEELAATRYGFGSFPLGASDWLDELIERATEIKVKIEEHNANQGRR